MNKLCLNSRDELVMIDLDQVAYFEANGNFTQIYYIYARGPLVGIGISKLEQYIAATLPKNVKSPLVRIGRSLIINQRYLSQISLTQQKLVLSDNAGHTYALSAPKPLLRTYKDMISGRKQTAPRSSKTNTDNTPSNT